MIVGSCYPARIGARFVGINDHDGVYRPEQPFVIAREATLEEYLADHEGKLEGMPQSQRAYLAAGGGFFYEVSLD